jgi:hypothetical protein
MSDLFIETFADTVASPHAVGELAWRHHVPQEYLLRLRDAGFAVGFTVK